MTNIKHRITAALGAAALAASLSLVAVAPANAAPAQVTQSTQAGLVEIGYYATVCKVRTAWYDPWNWFGTGRWGCQTEWIP